MANESSENELYNNFTNVENIICVIGFLKGMINENELSFKDENNDSKNQNDSDNVLQTHQTKAFNRSTLLPILERINIALKQTLSFKRKLDNEKLELVLDLYDYKELKKRMTYNSRNQFTYIGRKKKTIHKKRNYGLTIKKNKEKLLVEKISRIKEKDSLIKLIDSECYYLNHILAYTQILMQMESINKNQIHFLINGVKNLISKLESEKDNEFNFIWNFDDNYPIGLKLVYVLGFFNGIKKTLIVDENHQKIMDSLNELILGLIFQYKDDKLFGRSYMEEQNDAYYDYYTNYEDDGEENLRIGGNPLEYDSSANPWIEVFGPGDEAEMAYWNND